MKKLLFLFSAMLIAQSHFAQTQSYTFQANLSPYEEFTDRTVEDTLLTDYFEFKPSFHVTLFNQKTTQPNFTAGTATGYLISGNSAYAYAMDPLLGVRFRKIPNKSRVNAGMVVSGTDSQLVVQWKDMGFFGHPDNEFVNCQVRISKASGKITYHYGPSNYVRTTNDSAFTDPKHTGPELLLVKLSADFNNVFEFNTVAGSPQSPYFTTQFERMTGLPLANQRFVFTPKTPVAAVEQVSRFDRQLKVYPNPSVGQQLFIEAPETVTNIVAKNILGQTLDLQVSGLHTQTPQVSFGQPVQPLWLEITLANGETIVRKITIGN